MDQTSPPQNPPDEEQELITSKRQKTHKNEYEERLRTLEIASQKMQTISCLMKDLRRNIFDSFQVELSDNFVELNQTLISLRSFYTLLRNAPFPIENATSGFFSLLPPELILHIFSFLYPSDLCRCALVNFEFKKLSEEKSLWKNLCHRLKYDPFWTKKEKLTEQAIDWKSICKWHFLCEKKLITNSLLLELTEEVIYATDIQCDGSNYKGEWKNGKKHGKGIQNWAEGDIYKGEWKDGKRTGWGIHIWPDGHYYEGEYADDKRNGFGLFRWPDGREYRGYYIADQRNGFGEFLWPNGDRYIGTYKDSNRNGEGTFTWADGRKYEGEWKDGGYHGIGEYTHRDGSRYKGEWVDNFRHGFGIFYWTDGDYFEGQWIEGKRFGPGKLYYFENGHLTEKFQFWTEDRFIKHNKGLAQDSEGDKKRKISIEDNQFDEDSQNGPQTKKKEKYQ